MVPRFSSPVAHRFAEWRLEHRPGPCQVGRILSVAERYCRNSCQQLSVDLQLCRWIALGTMIFRQQDAPLAGELLACAS